MQTLVALNNDIEVPYIRCIISTHHGNKVSLVGLSLKTTSGILHPLRLHELLVLLYNKDFCLSVNKEV